MSGCKKCGAPTGGYRLCQTHRQERRFEGRASIGRQDDDSHDEDDEDDTATDGGRRQLRVPVPDDWTEQLADDRLVAEDGHASVEDNDTAFGGVFETDHDGGEVTFGVGISSRAGRVNLDAGYSQGGPMDGGGWHAGALGSLTPGQTRELAYHLAVAATVAERDEEQDQDDLRADGGCYVWGGPGDDGTPPDVREHREETDD